MNGKKARMYRKMAGSGRERLYGDRRMKVLVMAYSEANETGGVAFSPHAYRLRERQHERNPHRRQGPCVARLTAGEVMIFWPRFMILANCERQAYQALKDEHQGRTGEKERKRLLCGLHRKSTIAHMQKLPHYRVKKTFFGTTKETLWRISRIYRKGNINVVAHSCRREMKKITLAIILGAILCAVCSDPKTARRVLEQDGYTEVKITGWQFFGCDKHDDFTTGFMAKNANGALVNGVVCSDLIGKGATIRFF